MAAASPGGKGTGAASAGSKTTMTKRTREIKHLIDGIATDLGK